LARCEIDLDIEIHQSTIIGSRGNPDLLPQAELIEPAPAPRSGYLAAADAAEIGKAVMELGGGRQEMEDQIDHSVGVIVHYKVGDLVQKGTPLFTVHANDAAKLATARERMLAAHIFSDSPIRRPPLFYRRVADTGDQSASH